MKVKIIALLTLLIFILTIIAVQSTEYSLSGLWEEQNTYDELGNGSIAGYDGNTSKFTDGFYNTGDYLNGTMYVNYTMKLDSDSDSLWQVKSVNNGGNVTENLSLTSCWNSSLNKLVLKFAGTRADTIENNSKYCWYDNTWTRLGEVYDNATFYEEGIFWNVIASTIDFAHTLVSPSAYSTSTSTSVVFNISANWSGVGYPSVNCSLYSRTSSSASPVENVSDMILLNGSYLNVSVDYIEGNRVWWFWSCEDNFSRHIINTSERILDVDEDYYTLSLGANKYINFTLDTGDIKILNDFEAGGDITTTSITIDYIDINQNTSLMTCNNANRGRIYYDNATNNFYGCNSTSWALFNG